MSERMERAMAAADHCWAKAMEQAPEFVAEYLRLCEYLLLCNSEVQGDKFTKWCRDNGLQLPTPPPGEKPLHPNTWVCGPRVLEKAGWITKLGKVTPVEMQNHMPTVTMWRSNLTF